jgi:hypothetical protein
VRNRTRFSSTRFSRLLVVALPLTFIAAAASLLIGPAAATAAGDSGPDTCLEGYVWRDAVPNDHVCVTPATRSQAAADNSQAAARRDPTGPFGPNTCVSGYVWRVAVPTDLVCVTPAIRSQTAADNATGADRRASLNIWFTHWTVPPVCNGSTCTVGSTDNIPRFKINGDHFNLGQVYVGVFRFSDNSPIWATTITATFHAGFVAGSFGVQAPVFDCAAINAAGGNDAYLQAYDYITTRWSAPINVHANCAVL